MIKLKIDKKQHTNSLDVLTYLKYLNQYKTIKNKEINEQYDDIVIQIYNGLEKEIKENNLPVIEPLIYNLAYYYMDIQYTTSGLRVKNIKEDYYLDTTDVLTKYLNSIWIHKSLEVMNQQYPQIVKNLIKDVGAIKENLNVNIDKIINERNRVLEYTSKNKDSYFEETILPLMFEIRNLYAVNLGKNQEINKSIEENDLLPKLLINNISSLKEEFLKSNDKKGFMEKIKKDYPLNEDWLKDERLSNEIKQKIYDLYKTQYQKLLIIKDIQHIKNRLDKLPWNTILEEYNLNKVHNNALLFYYNKLLYYKDWLEEHKEDTKNQKTNTLPYFYNSFTLRKMWGKSYKAEEKMDKLIELSSINTKHQQSLIRVFFDSQNKLQAMKLEYPEIIKEKGLMDTQYYYNPNKTLRQNHDLMVVETDKVNEVVYQRRMFPNFTDNIETEKIWESFDFSEIEKEFNCKVIRVKNSMEGVAIGEEMNVCLARRYYDDTLKKGNSALWYIKDFIPKDKLESLGLTNKTGTIAFLISHSKDISTPSITFDLQQLQGYNNHYELHKFLNDKIGKHLKSSMEKVKDNWIKEKQQQLNKSKQDVIQEDIEYGVE